MKFELPQEVNSLPTESQRDLRDALAQVEIAKSLFGDISLLFKGIASVAAKVFNYFYPTAAMRSQRGA